MAIPCRVFICVRRKLRRQKNWPHMEYSWAKQNSLSFTVHLYNLNYAPTPKDKRNIVLRGCLPTFSTREKGWEKPIVFKTYQSSGSQSRNPLANGLLAIFNCVIWLRKQIRTIISMYMHQTPVQHFLNVDSNFPLKSKYFGCFKPSST